MWGLLVHFAGDVLTSILVLIVGLLAYFLDPETHPWCVRGRRLECSTVALWRSTVALWRDTASSRPHFFLPQGQVRRPGCGDSLCHNHCLVCLAAGPVLLLDYPAVDAAPPGPRGVSWARCGVGGLPKSVAGFDSAL